MRRKTGTPLQPAALAYGRQSEACATMAETTQKRARDADADADADAVDPKKMRESINDAAKEFICPITHELPIQPVMAEDGKIYEREAIVEWFARKATSPSTNAAIGPKLVPVVQVRNTIESLIQTGAIEREIAEAWHKRLEFGKRVKEMRAKAEGGDGEAMQWMGVSYTYGQSVAKDDAQARAWFERSAAARNPKGLASFSHCLVSGIGGPQDISFGLVNLTEAAGLGSDFGAYLLGWAFFNGAYGLPKDSVRARYWLNKLVDGECEFKHLCPTHIPLATRMLASMDAAPAE